MGSVYEAYSKVIIKGRTRIIYKKKGSKTQYIKSNGRYVKYTDYKKRIAKGGTGQVINATEQEKEHKKRAEQALSAMNRQGQAKKLYLQNSKGSVNYMAPAPMGTLAYMGPQNSKGSINYGAPAPMGTLYGTQYFNNNKT